MDYIAGQAPLSIGFSRQEYWSGLPCPPPRDLPNPGIKLGSLMSPALAGGFFTSSTTWEAQDTYICRYIFSTHNRKTYLMFLICKGKSCFHQRQKITISPSLLQSLSSLPPLFLPLSPLLPSSFLPSFLLLLHGPPKNEMAPIKSNSNCPCESYMAYLWKFYPNGPWALWWFMSLRTQTVE